MSKLEIEYPYPQHIIAQYKTVGDKKELQQYQHGTIIKSLGVGANETGNWIKMASYMQHPLIANPEFQGTIYLWGRVGSENNLEMKWMQEAEGSGMPSIPLGEYKEGTFKPFTHGTQANLPLIPASIEESRAFFFKEGSTTPSIPHNTWHAGYIIPQSSANVTIKDTTYYKDKEGNITPSDIEPGYFTGYIMTYGNISSYWYTIAFGKLYILQIDHLKSSSNGTIFYCTEEDRTKDDWQYKTTQEPVALPFTQHDFFAEADYHFTSGANGRPTPAHAHVGKLFVSASSDLMTERGMHMHAFKDFTISPSLATSIVLGQYKDGEFQQWQHGTLGSRFSACGFRGLISPKQSQQHALENNSDYEIICNSIATYDVRLEPLITNVGFQTGVTSRSLACKFELLAGIDDYSQSFNMRIAAAFTAGSGQRPSIQLDKKTIINKPDEDGDDTNGWSPGDPEEEETHEEEPPEGGDTVEFYEYFFDGSCQVLFTVENPTYLESLRDKFKSLIKQEISQYIALARKQRYTIAKKSDSDYTKTKAKSFSLDIETSGGDTFSWGDIPVASCSNRATTLDYLSSSSQNGKEYTINTSVSTKARGTDTVTASLAMNYEEIDFNADFILEGSTSWDATENLQGSGTLELREKSTESMQLETEVWQVKWTEVEYIKGEDGITTRHTRKYTKYYVDEDLAQSSLDEAKASELTTSSSMTKVQSIYTHIKINHKTLWLDKAEIENILHWNEDPTVFENWLKSVHSIGNFTITAEIN